MYGLYWFIGIILLIAAMLVWLDALLKRGRRGETDLFAAKNLIVEGLPLEAVAEQVGFSDYSAFYRAFKGEFGISPRQFRIQTGIQAERQSGA